MDNVEFDLTPEEILSTEVKKETAKKSCSFDPKNYLNVKLDKGQTEKKIKIRLLNVEKGAKTPWKHIHMHNIKVPKEISASGFKSYVCLRETEGKYTENLGTKCPFCELRQDAYNKSLKATTQVEKERLQKISLSMIPLEVGIIRCIERGHEDEGPKFWKFNLRNDKKDPESQIRALYKTRMDESIEEGDETPMNILSFIDGKDLEVTISAVYDNNGALTNKTSISIIDCGRNKPLHQDPNQINAWLNDEKVWSDVFVAKPYEYTSILLEGKVPYFNKEAGKWVAKEENIANNETKKTEADNSIKVAEEKLMQQNNNASSVQQTTVSKAEIEDINELPY